MIQEPSIIHTGGFIKKYVDLMHHPQTFNYIY